MTARARPAKRNTTDSAKLRAIQLLGRWTRLAQGHVVLGAGCSCGAELASVPVTDFQNDILDYLRNRHGAALAQLRATGLADLLRAIANASPDAAGFGPLLRDVEQSIESFEATHRI